MTKWEEEDTATTTTNGYTYTTNYKYKVENKKRLGLCTIENSGPRGSTDKILVLKRN
jgi:hypothetical protein